MYGARTAEGVHRGRAGGKGHGRVTTVAGSASAVGVHERNCTGRQLSVVEVRVADGNIIEGWERGQWHGEKMMGETR